MASRRGRRRMAVADGRLANRGKRGATSPDVSITQTDRGKTPDETGVDARITQKRDQQRNVRFAPTLA
eukprot:scaffold33954_cov27-Phaeocystis_antarctica.AAC.1